MSGDDGGYFRVIVTDISSSQILVTYSDHFLRKVLPAAPSIDMYVSLLLLFCSEFLFD